MGGKKRAVDEWRCGEGVGVSGWKDWKGGSARAQALVDQCRLQGQWGGGAPFRPANSCAWRRMLSLLPVPAAAAGASCARRCLCGRVCARVGHAQTAKTWYRNHRRRGGGVALLGRRRPHIAISMRGSGQFFGGVRLAEWPHATCSCSARADLQVDGSSGAGAERWPLGVCGGCAGFWDAVDRGKRGVGYESGLWWTCVE